MKNKKKIENCSLSDQFIKWTQGKERRVSEPIDKPKILDCVIKMRNYQID